MIKKIFAASWLLISSFTGANAMDEKQGLEHITVESAYQLILDNLENEEFMILDVRTPSEFDSARVEGAINIDYYASDFSSKLDSLDKEKLYLVYCRSGNRSGKTLKIMSKLGFKNALNMLGGIKQWNSLDLPTIPTI